MKYLIILSITLLVGCSDYKQPNEATSKAFIACLEKNWVPTYSSGAGEIFLKCTPQR